MRPGFEGGQMPVYMRMASSEARTRPTRCRWARTGRQTQPVNVRDLERFDAGTDVTLELLAETGLIKNTRIDVKILGNGDLTKNLTVTAHRFSASARQKIEGAGGSVVALREDVKKKKRKKSRAAKPAAAEAPEAEAPEDKAEAQAAEPEQAEETAPEPADEA